MATYIIGDIQGCYDELKSLLKLVQFSPKQDELWITGDIIARGPKSLKTLRFIKNLGPCAKVVLGNHDLHLLAIDQGIHSSNKKDKLSGLLKAHDRNELLNWLRMQPLLLRHPEFNFIMVHAGISPQWTLTEAEQLAQEVEQQLRSDHYPQFLKEMYGNQPQSWSPDLQGIDRLRFAVNVFTRMRYCFADGSLDFGCKLAPQQIEDKNQLVPWFEVETLDKRCEIVFGHWAALLGKTNKPGIYGLDTGCVWGNSLTMLRWQDKKIFSLSCPVYSS
ncbi:symmetrical bis(5'-nucleosyl)-tetraphosphatase [Psychromonas sp. MME2]|uniref:symmetrical bis(5'-nucleosyl)-tetraphosphatase n=1 Tax=unclassified Psychromonas TaxID=2614957 RepID=UPI00339C38FD